MAEKIEKEFTLEEISKHNSENSFWVIIDNVVYDLTNFLSMHPGGEMILLPFGGKDVTDDFYSLHRTDELLKFGPKYMIGKVKNAKEIILPIKNLGELSAVPFSESSFWQGWKSPYFNDSHKRFKLELRKFFEGTILPEAKLFDKDDKPPSNDIFLKAGAFGLWASRIGPGPHLKGFQLPGGVKPEEFDYFHEMIAHEEIQCLGYPGYSDGLACGMVIGLPPVMKFGRPELINRVVPEVLYGKKKICLSITEPFAGSDVANIQCTATLSQDGKHYIVNGVKKWITNGSFCDYFTTAVRTGDGGMEGISMLLIERGPGLRTKSIKTSYSSSAGTAYIIMENVKVPVENLLGKVNQGFKVIMFNFNHERWLIICQSIRASRLVIEESLKWANQRKVFGNSLLDQPVIRAKFASMIAQVEGLQNWLENITYQMTKMSYHEQSTKLAGPIALLKYNATKVGTYVSDESCQIFGGRSITQSGMGQIIDRIHRSVKFAAILGGSEEIMAELGMKQTMKSFPNNARL